MDISIFSRGITIGKRAVQVQIKKIAAPTQVTILINNERRFEMNLTVEKGDQVKRGQVIAEDVKGFSKHATISGTIESVEDLTKPTSEKIKAVGIKSDDQNESI